MKKLLNNAVAVIVVMIVLLLIIPLNPFILDVMIILNISISLIILLISMNIKEPLEFSIFPSMLLITTLFRIGINISSTRNILGKQGTAGAVIQAMGDFVLQGNVVVGCIIFMIIVLVQFIVITKGAERVAEVAARFTLDAMPGKQMAIDADLSTGLIDEQQARERRYKIQKEADFYGAMDGATKIVKGDAIMSLIITAVNFLGGMIIGMVQSGMGFSEVLSVYSIATVGDGLVSQIPALLISTATGMVVTRSVSDGSLNEDASKQFTAQPRALMITGATLAVMLVIPGMPKIQLGLVSLALILGGYAITRKMEEVSAVSDKTAEMEEAMARQQEAVSEEEAFKDISNVYELINVEPIEMEFGYSLIPLVDEGSGGKMINRIVIFRRQYAQEMGLVIPSIRLRDSSSLNTNQYVIKIRGVKTLHKTEYSIIPDQIEAGTFMFAAAATKGDVTVLNVIPKHLEATIAKLLEIGCEVEEFDDAVRVVSKGDLRSTHVKTLPYPGFPTDMQPQMGVTLALCKGTSIVTESIFENRFKYLDELARMGANVKVEGNSATIEGVEKLSGARVSAPDLRAGAALCIAGLATDGITIVDDIVYIQRGYERFEEKIRGIGGIIERVSTEREIQKFKLKVS